MDPLQIVRNKYKDKDFIEISNKDCFVAINWLTGLDPLNEDIEKVVDNLAKLIKARGGFSRFINSGVLVIKQVELSTSDFTGVFYFPFQFEGIQKLTMSIVIADPDEYDLEKQMVTVARVTIGTDLKIPKGDVLRKDVLVRYFQEVSRHKSKAFDRAVEIAKKAGYKETDKYWGNELMYIFYNRIVFSQIATCLSVHAYLSVHEKEILITKVTQTRQFFPGKSNGKVQHKNRNLLYRYVVELPKDYKPRKFDINYIIEQWTIAGHTRGIWVNVENVAVLERKYGKENTTVEQIMGSKVKLRIPIKPTTGHRKIGNPTEGFQSKNYSTH